MSEGKPIGSVVAVALVVAALAGGGYGLARISDLEARCDGLSRRHRAVPAATTPTPSAQTGQSATPAAEPVDPERLKDASDRAEHLRKAIAFVTPDAAAGPVPPETVRAVDEAFPEAMTALEADLRDKITAEKVLEPLGVPSIESWEESNKASLAKLKIVTPEARQGLFDIVLRSLHLRNEAVAEAVNTYKTTGVWDDKKMQEQLGQAMGTFSLGVQEKFGGRANEYWSVFWTLYTVPDQTRDQGEWQIVYSSDRNASLKIRAEWK